MITSEPIGDWSWEIATSADGIRPTSAVETALAVFDVLAGCELAIPVGKAFVSVRSMDSRDVRVLVDGLGLEPDPLIRGMVLSHALVEAGSPEGDVIVDVRIECPGYWRESGIMHRAEKLFVIQVEIWKSSLLMVTLETYSDAWLTVDTRDREQPEVYAENAPRLAAALKGITSLLGSAPVPGAPNRYATPTVTGFEDPRAEGPAYDDSWGTFELPARSGLLRSRIPASEDEYEETTDNPVRYFTVRREGVIVGYVWAAVGEEAAGFEPRTAAGEAAFEAGAGWLLRLRAAHAQGLNALAALAWLAQSSSRPEIGEFFEDSPLEAPSLDALEELSGRY
ncbi:hypothetical protein OHT76_13100 [Streptomyces sp. NBC_00287]|uniref:hypothetical protein n=1 Tax=Streptomyces sp. NBC_00287 TaxID=2975702 RepID=UPI002E2A3CE4|nr:hypothetical protein [Streptomyces sp. NBC_00287]